MNATLTHQPVTMSSREIAELVNSRHDKVKQSIERLVARGVIVQPPLGDEPETDAIGRVRSTQVYRIGKRDSYVIVAQLSPEFTARLVDRWQELEAQQAPRPLTTTETLIQMLTLQAEVERRQAAQGQAIVAVEKRVDLIEATAPLTAKPQNTESISEIRARINRKHGLPERIINEVMFQLPGNPKPFAMVRNGHENAQGSSFAVWAIKDITKLFERFVGECRPATATTSTHPYIDGRFKLIRRE